VRHAALALLAILACNEAPTPAAPTPAEPTPAEPTPAPTVAPPQAWRADPPGSVPSDPDAIRSWLQAFVYRQWTPQTDIRATGEHGGERLYFNAALTASMRAGNPAHPPGSAAVRELYAGDLRTLKGFALMHKTGPSGPSGEGWYWYEIFGTGPDAEPTVAAPAAPGCVGCHAHADDFVHSPDTPRDDPQPLL
jgi:hypothetical protein